MSTAARKARMMLAVALLAAAAGLHLPHLLLAALKETQCWRFLVVASAALKLALPVRAIRLSR